MSVVSERVPSRDPAVWKMKFSSVIVMALAAGVDAFAPSPRTRWAVTKRMSSTVETVSAEEKREQLLAKADMLLASAPSAEERKKMESAFAAPAAEGAAADPVAIAEVTIDAPAGSPAEKREQLLAKAEMLLASAPSAEERKKKESAFAAPAAEGAAADPVAVEDVTVKAPVGSPAERREQLLRKAEMLLANAPAVKQVVTELVAASEEVTMDVPAGSPEEKREQLLRKAEMLLASAKQ